MVVPTVKHLKKVACTDCHLGVVHPHMPGDLFKAYAARKIKRTVRMKRRDCLACHKMATPDVVKEWTKGAPRCEELTCISCHGNEHRSIAKKREVMFLQAPAASAIRINMLTSESAHLQKRASCSCHQ